MGTLVDKILYGLCLEGWLLEYITREMEGIGLVGWLVSGWVESRWKTGVLLLLSYYSFIVCTYVTYVPPIYSTLDGVSQRRYTQA